MDAADPVRPLADPERRSAGCIVIGLVNNMPDAALQSTERQFRELLGAASNGREVLLKLFSFPEIRRGEAARRYIGEHYEPIGSFEESGLDGLIVTGAEPRAAKLTEEPYWDSLTKLVAWAEDHTASAIWSCLAAHAAVYYLDAIPRQRLEQKLSGVFSCQKRAEHPLCRGMAPSYLVPHSRYNDLPESALRANGYQVLANSAEAGADLFTKVRGKSLFVFLQGHPEYDARALYREYRRDCLRYLNAERADHPSPPRAYFEEPVALALDALRTRALAERDPALIESFSSVEKDGGFAHRWKDSAVLLYANWLALLAEHKARMRLPEAPACEGPFPDIEGRPADMLLRAAR